MLYDTVTKINAFLWGWPFIIFIIFIGIYFILASKCFPIVHFGHIMKYTIGSLLNNKSIETFSKRKGTISPIEAGCIAIGGSVGCTAIGGVATAIATGGPGAVFWMWVWAILGMIIKCVETSLGCYYRYRNEKGEYYGGSVYFIADGIGKDMHLPKIAKYLTYLFSFGFVAQFLGGSQVFTIAEILNRSFGFNMIIVTLIYSAALFYIIFKGVPRIASFAVRVVPFMCVFFILAGLGVIFVNIEQLPFAFRQIITGAFSDTAAIGGFAGATIIQTINDGLARSINSNEVGQGSSPLIYGSADTIHPIRQGLWGSFDVFINTIVISTITALAVLVTGVWNSGEFGATLAIMAYDSVYGYPGVFLIGLVAILFGLTTTTGWFTYYISIIQYVFKDHPHLRDKTITLLKYMYPLPNIIIVSSIVLTGNGPDLFWTLVNITLVFPVGFNLLSIFFLKNKFKELLADYKARYMNIGSINPSFKIFRNTPMNK